MDFCVPAQGQQIQKSIVMTQIWTEFLIFFCPSLALPIGTTLDYVSML